MERLFDDIIYAKKAQEANEQRKILKIVQKEVEYETEVLEWDYVEAQETRPKYDEEGNPVTHKETILNPIYNEEGEIIGYDEPTEINVQETETITVQKAVPHMVTEPVIDPETGEPMVDPETGEIITHEVQGHHTETRTKIVEDLEIVDNPDGYDFLTLTPADVERALIKAKNMNFDELKQLIAETMTGIDTKALNAEFGANLFYRGAKFGSGRLFDVIAPLIGYTAEDMDILFLTKELPVKEDK